MRDSGETVKFLIISDFPDICLVFLIILKIKVSPHDIRGASTVTHFFSQNFLDFKPIIEMLNFLCTGNMVMKQQHKTR